MLISLSVSAQNSKSISGTIVDATGEAVIGASVSVKGTTAGTATDLDGNFQLNVADDAVLVISYIGYATQEISVAGKSTLNIVMKEDTQLLDELVVIGYGTMKKGDLTGSITAIGEKDFAKGVATSAAELLTGKVAGVQITSNGGRAGSGSRIRIRGGASLNASNDPLIVIDGVPVANSGITGSSDVLSTINPNDIESMNILKDASATAIYGSRASNGVIIITTKKGTKGQALKVNLSTQNSISTIAKTVDVMSADEFREVVQNNPFTDDKYIGYLGTANTDWQKEIYRNAFTTDNNISVSGSVKDLPYRVSAGFISQDGVLKTDNMKRGSAAISLSPVLLDQHLNVNINLKGTYTNSFFGNGDAIGAAVRMDPTQPVTAEGFDKFNGYWTWMNGDTGLPNSLATKNPVALLNAKHDEYDVLRSIGNIQFDYKMHFLPELRANLNLGYDISNSEGNTYYLPWAPDKFTQGEGGERSKGKQDKRNLLLEFYLNYAKEFKSSRLEVMGGYTYQDWKTTDYNYITTDYAGDYIVSTPTYPTNPYQNTLISFYGRLNYSLMSKYLLTATIRQDGSSRFSKNHRWGTFPSVALAWRINEEDFLKGFDKLSNLKLRLGYGITGQQDGINDYDYIPVYSLSDLNAQYQLGDQFYQGYRPSGYDKDHKWEQTATTNVGLDWGFFNNRLYGGVDYYFKKTKDLLNTIDIPMGVNFTNRITKNIGSMENNGVEVTLGVVAIDTKDMRWDMGFNATFNHTKITQLTTANAAGSNYVGTPTGGISGGTGNNIQMHSVNHAPNTFYLYKQLYFEDGTPVEGAYADLNGDGVVNEQDKYFVHKPEPDVFLGFNTNFTYKKWSAGTSLRASIGNYMYNNTFSDLGNYSQLFNPNNFLMNTVKDINNSQFYNRNLMSDYYLQNASFLKMDYFTVGYNFGRIANALDLALNLSVQNVFTITKYDGVDPEIAGGIDNNFYPNPRTFSLGLTLNF
ncbi:SusC/RagA family TonB-linked outer membrane protein [Bacteroidia bacterium]|nr:SusC/RagA family TonB-linked outer membrane protein [Bacteroidia bacterium]